MKLIVKIEHDLLRLGARVYAGYEAHDGFHVLEAGEQITDRVLADSSIDDPVKPLLHLPGTLGEQLLQALAEALSQDGVKTDSDAKIEGTLKATQYHLEDLRRLLKIPELKKDE